MSQVVPVLEQQLGDVQADLENQEGLAKELSHEVHGDTRMSHPWYNLLVQKIKRPSIHQRASKRTSELG